MLAKTRELATMRARAIESSDHLFSFQLVVFLLSRSPSSLSLHSNSNSGKWGVVTGATDGIGRAYVNALAKAGEFFFLTFSFVEAEKKKNKQKRNSTSTPSSSSSSSTSHSSNHFTGLNVALLSRTESKLTAAASEIEAKYKVDTKVVAVDFGAATAADYARIAGVVGDLDVAVLVNNVGLSYDHAEYYDAIDDRLIDDLIAINIQATNKVRRFCFFCVCCCCGF